MNKKRFFACMLALLFAALPLCSCARNPEDPSDGPQTPEKPFTSADFADALVFALRSQSTFTIGFDIMEKHDYNPTFSMEKVLFSRLEADFADPDDVRFLYRAQRNPEAAVADVILFYERGQLYVKDGDVRYRQSRTSEQALGGLPTDPLAVLFGEDLGTVFSKGTLASNADGSRTATAEVPVSHYSDNVRGFLETLGIVQSEYAQNVYGDIRVRADMKDGRLLSYGVTVETEMLLRDGTSYPVVYTVSATYGDPASGASPALPDSEKGLVYLEAEPEITEISAGDFAARFRKSNAVANLALYTRMTTNAVATYEFSGNTVSVPLLNVTEVDASDPMAPRIAVVETKNTLGTIKKTEIYYKDDTYYYAQGNSRFSMPYPAEEYIANVEASAKENEAAGLTARFLTEAMLANAVFTVNPDQSVTAVMTFDGESQRENLFYNIKSLYNDEFSRMQDVSVSETRVCITLDRFNHLLSYTLETAVSAVSNGMPSVLKYSIQYGFDYSELPREIDFPDDLNSEKYPLRGGDVMEL